MVIGRRIICKTMRRVFAKGDKPYTDSIVYQDNFDIMSDIDYVGDGDYFHLLDLVRPKGSTQKLPLIVHIHGGGYFYGTKDTYYKYYGVLLCLGGYAVATINYPLAPNATIDEQIRCCVMAINFLADNADKYNLDANQIYLVGDSAGANLCAVVSTLCSNAHIQALSGLECKFSICAQMLSHGLYNFDSLTDGNNAYMEMLLRCAFNSKKYKDKPAYKYASPLQNITSCFAPTYLVSSLYDGLSPQSVELADKLKEQNIESICEFYPKELQLPHVFNVKENNEYAPKVRQTMYDFFAKHSNKESTTQE